MTGSDTNGSPHSFEWDVFISYAHADDNRLVNEPVGWVTQFRDNFFEALQEQLGREPKIWMDSDITPNEDFEKKIVNRLIKSAIFLPVLSKIFINRWYCLHELQTFVETAERQLTTYVGVDGEKKRIFIVEKLPVDRSRLPKELQGLGGTFPFHQGAQTLRPALCARESHDLESYYRVLNRLSRTASDLIELAAKTEGSAPARGLPVYLAETTSDLDEQREALRDDLIDRGFQVLPELQLPHQVDKYKEVVQNCLNRAVLSVHLVGREYGFIPEGEKELSNVRLQHRLALERAAQEPPMTQVIWLAGDVAAGSDERQQAFIDYLKNDEAAASAELIESDFESLKTDLTEKLTKLQKSFEAQEAASQKPDHPLVYIICTKADRASPHLKALKKYLYDQGCETRFFTDGGSEDEALKAHQQKLKDFDAFLIYHGSGSESWLEAQLDEFYTALKSRAKPVLAKAVYLAPPETFEKEDFETHEALVLRASDAFSPATVEPFLRLCGKAPASSS